MLFENNVVKGDDFWNPVPGVSVRGQTGTDFWSDLPQPVADIPGLIDIVEVSGWDFPNADGNKSDQAADWSQDGSLPWFDGARVENPYNLNLAPTSPEQLAMQRGRWLCLFLNIPETRRRRTMAFEFAEIFDRFPSASTFRVLTDIALSDVEAEEVLNGCHFKTDLMDHPYYSVQRYGSRLPYTPTDPQVLISWQRAIGLAKQAGCNPMDLVEEDWLEQWRSLRRDHFAYWSFVDYIEWQLHSPLPLGAFADHAPGELNLEKFRASFGLAPASRTGSLVQVDRGHMGVLYPEPKIPTLTLRALN